MTSWWQQTPAYRMRRMQRQRSARSLSGAWGRHASKSLPKLQANQPWLGVQGIRAKGPKFGKRPQTAFL